MAQEKASSTEHDQVIWRYMDLPKFVHMLATQRLWFAKAATFNDDPYEGFCEVTPRQHTPSEQEQKPIRRETSTGFEQISVGRMIAEVSELSAEYLLNARDHLYVNSWCIGVESMAMWQIYGSLGHGVAVKSSIEDYKRAADFQIPSSQYRFGSVEYHDDITMSREIRRDFTTGPVPLPGPGLWREILPLAFHKRSCFLYEHEWRAALYQDSQPEAHGVQERFDLDDLISAVYVGPRAGEFVTDAVSALMDRFELRKPLHRSALLRPPEAKRYALGEI